LFSEKWAGNERDMNAIEMQSGLTSRPDPVLNAYEDV
jgi:hypothetical protein